MWVVFLRYNVYAIFSFRYEVCLESNENALQKKQLKYKTSIIYKTWKVIQLSNEAECTKF